MASERRILPLSIVYLDDALVLINYCTLRQATRVFRMDRLSKIALSDESFYPRRVRLLKDALAVIQKTEI